MDDMRDAVDCVIDGSLSKARRTSFIVSQHSACRCHPVPRMPNSFALCQPGTARYSKQAVKMHVVLDVSREAQQFLLCGRSLLDTMATFVLRHVNLCSRNGGVCHLPLQCTNSTGESLPWLV
jgi:hypothetical protein